MVCITHCSITNMARASLAVLALFIASARAGESEQIVTSIKPLALIAREISAGTGLNSGYLLAPSVSEHNYALKISDVKRLREAKLVVWLDKDIEPYLHSSRDSWSGPDGSKKSLALLEAMASTLHQNHRHNEEDHGDRGAVDPHAWLNPVLAQQLARQVASSLGEMYPENKQHFDSNLTTFIQKSATLDKVTAKALAPYSDAPFFVDHDAYGYFVERYHLKQVGVMQIQPGAALSLKQLGNLQQTLDNQPHPPCFFREPQLTRKLSPAFDGGSVIQGQLDPLGIDAGTYSELIENLTKGFLDCFERAKKEESK